MRHISESVLGLYVLDPALLAERAVLEAHLRTCVSCRRRLAEIQTFDAALRSPEAWQEGPERERAPRVDDLRRFAVRAAAEDREATHLLSGFEKAEEAARFVWANIAEKGRYQTGGVARLLNKRANTMCERKPEYALALAEAASAISQLLPDATYPGNAIHELRGEAFKEQGNALRLLGRFHEALEMLDCAEAEYAQLKHHGIGIVAVKYVRAYVLLEQEHYDAAEQLAIESATAARHLGDADREMRAQHLRGDIKFERGQTVAASELFLAIREYGESVKDPVWIARESLALGVCYTELGRLAEASRSLYTALRLFRELEHHTQITRAEWAIARLMFQQGNRVEAINYLKTSVRALVGHGMLTDAAIAAIDLAEMLHATSRAREIPSLLAGVTETFTKAGKITAALTALAYVKDAAVAGSITPGLISYVRRFVVRADRTPELLFAPPPSV